MQVSSPAFATEQNGASITGLNKDFRPGGPYGLSRAPWLRGPRVKTFVGSGAQSVRQSLLQSVLRLFVSPQVHFPLEPFAALIAAEGLEARVFAAVRDEVGALAEGLAAHLALVGLLPCKDPQIKTSTRQSMASTI